MEMTSETWAAAADPGPAPPTGVELPRSLVEVDGVPVGELVAAGRTLPSSWFSSDEIYGLEQRLIFRRAWNYVGAASQLASVGDYFTCRVAGIPVVVVRGKDEVLRAFVNICRHRHHEVAQGSGNRSTLQCIYHGWTYKLDGSFNAAPRSNEDPDFDGTPLCLKQLRVEAFGDMIYVNPDPDARPLLETLGPVPELAEKRGWPMGSALFRARKSIEFPANWKVVYENNAECYHCPTSHKSYAKEIGFRPDRYHDNQVGSHHFETDVFMDPGSPHDYAYYAWPAFFAMGGSLRPTVEEVARDGYMTWGIEPRSPRWTVVNVDIYHVEELSDAEAAEWFTGVFTIYEEDDAICRRIQEAHDSDVGGLGTLIPGIDSEAHVQVWERLIYRSLAEPEVNIYAPLD